MRDAAILTILFCSLALAGCLSDEGDPGQSPGQTIEEDAGMSSPLFIRTPVMAIEISTGHGLVDLYTADGAATLIEKLTYMASAPGATDAGTIAVYLTPPGGAPHAYKQVAVDANVSATLATQGEVRLDLTLPDGWNLSVASDVDYSVGGTPAVDVEFCAQGGELG